MKPCPCRGYEGTPTEPVKEFTPPYFYEGLHEMEITSRDGRVYSALEVANVFIALAKARGETLPNLKLQKLVFIAHGWSLAILGKPLFYEPVLAWRYGPVVKELYDALIHYGSGHVTDLIPIPAPRQPRSVKQKLGALAFAVGLKLFPSWRTEHDRERYVQPALAARRV